MTVVSCDVNMVSKGGSAVLDHWRTPCDGFGAMRGGYWGAVSSRCRPVCCWDGSHMAVSLKMRVCDMCINVVGVNVVGGSDMMNSTKVVGVNVVGGTDVMNSTKVMSVNMVSIKMMSTKMVSVNVMGIKMSEGGGSWEDGVSVSVSVGETSTMSKCGGGWVSKVGRSSMESVMCSQSRSLSESWGSGSGVVTVCIGRGGSGIVTVCIGRGGSGVVTMSICRGGIVTMGTVSSVVNVSSTAVVA